MTQKDIEKLFSESEGLDMSHVNKDDVLAKAKQEIYFGASAKAEPEKEKGALPRFFTKRRLIPTLAGVALAFTVFAGALGLYNENFQTVYIDINPSVALKLNRFERVVGVEYLNNDAKNLLAGVKLVGCDASDALTTVITACDNAGYVNASSEIYISAESNNDKDSEKILTKLKARAEASKGQESETYTVNTYKASKTEKENYKKEELSPAKYNIIREIIDGDDDYEIDDLKSKTMDELKRIKKDAKDDDKDDLDENASHGEGSNRHPSYDDYDDEDDASSKNNGKGNKSDEDEYEDEDDEVENGKQKREGKDLGYSYERK
jgi:hypothetical protein